MASTRQQEAQRYFLVAAIEFGTTFSGYAFSIRTTDPLQITSKIWVTDSELYESDMTTTCVLFDNKKKFHSFGFVAEGKYSDLSKDDSQKDTHKNWYFFKQFKMTLFEQMQSENTFMLEDVTGKKLPALLVFSECIAFMKRELMTDINRQIPGVVETEIRWVITVPSILNDNSKQFLREATEMAQIDGNNLVIALEPEVASLYCRYLPMNTSKGYGINEFLHFHPNSRYLVLDAGYCTIDITAYEVQKNGSLKELYKAIGCSGGWKYVENALYDILADIVGNEIMDEFSVDKSGDYRFFLRELNLTSKNFKNGERFTFKVPLTLNEMFKASRRMDIKDHIEKTPKYQGKFHWLGDKLRMEADTAKGLFSQACESISKHLQELYKDSHVRDVPTILMVGGFSESPMLQEALKREFPNKKIIIPADAGLAVLKGAVIFGHQQ